MMAEDNAPKEGTVVEALKGTMFRVLLDDSKTLILARLAGKMRLHYIRVLVGDRVRIELDQYTPDRGKIVKRL